VNRRVETLVAKANGRIARLDGTVPPGSFVCPTCLRLCPIARATEAHNPARTAPAVKHRTELQCADCNSRIGGTYESPGVDFMRFVRTVTMTRPGVPTPSLRRQAFVQNKDDAVSVNILTRNPRRSGRRKRHSHMQLDRVLEGSGSPRELAVTIERPTEDPAKRSILAWSFLATFYYAGYRYAASSGAELVRRLILDPSLPLPDGIVFTKGAIKMPLAAPEPVLVVRVEDGDEVEMISLGVMWDRLVVVLPFASDHNERSWTRLAELLALDELRTTEVRRLRTMHEEISKEVDASVEVQAGDDERHTVVANLSPLEVAALAEGVSARRIDPRAGGPWTTPMSVEHAFVTVEGEPPEKH
jgi:hypothetical protein